MSDNPFTVPLGWELERTDDLTSLTCPEGDLTVTFVESPPGGTVQETALAAWKKLDPAFDSVVLREAAIPPQGGWDETHQVIYQVPAKESRVELAMVRRLGTRAFVNLVRSSTAALSRRGAQLNESILSWKPAGYQEANLNDVAAAAWTDSHSSQLKEFMLSAMAAMQIPGVSIAIVQGGKVAWLESLGVRDLAGGEPVTPRTRFMIGSTTKPLTTLLMAKLIEQGKLGWSTPVVDLLHDFSLADPEVTSRLEVRHTASASTGMPRQDTEFVFKYSGVTPEERIAQMKTMRPTTAFGETFQYSNFLVAAGGYAAARAYSSTGAIEDAYESAITQLVFRPLGMHDTCLRQEHALRGDAALPHATDFDGNPAAIPLNMELAVYSVAPAGAIWSTASDLANYLLLELGAGQMPDGRRVIGEEALLERRVKGVKVSGNSSYGLGLFVSEEEGLRVIHHGGNTLGFSSDMYFLPDKDLGVAVLTNASAANAFLLALRQRVFELAFGAEPKAEKTIAAAAKIRDEGIALMQSKATIDPAPIAWAHSLPGRYHCAELGSGEITSRGDAGFWMQFEEWGSLLGFETEPAGGRILRLLSPPWRGGLKLLIDPDTGTLTLDGGQKKYVFHRQ